MYDNSLKKFFMKFINWEWRDNFKDHQLVELTMIQNLTANSVWIYKFK